MKSVYIHIPFCNNICSYCDFPKLYYNDDLVDKYLFSLEKEITSTYKNETIDTIYIGGGTPSCLSINQLKTLFKILSRINKSDNLEYTIECNFDSLTNEKLDLYKENGINRISFGLESINNDKLNYLNRTLDKNNVKSIITYCKNIGITNINVDLIYAVYNETLDILEKDIDFILDLDVTHISTYSLIIEENTKLYINNEKDISEDLDSDMYNLIISKLTSNGYNHYEISNFAKPGFESKHNLCYWNNNRYYGFGLGAASYIDNNRIENTKSITSYIKNNYQLNSEVVDKDDEIRYEIILNLRLTSGISKKIFYNKYKREIKELFQIDELITNKLLEENSTHIYIPRDKLYLSNEIIIKFLEGESNEK